MNMKRTALAVALSFGAAFGAMEASASVYGRSYIDIDNLTLGAFNADGSLAGVVIRDFVVNVTNTASLDGAVGGQMTAGCTFVGPLACPVDDFDPTTPVLDAPPSTVGAPAAVNNMFMPFQGAGNDEYSRADSVVHEAAVIAIRDGGDPFTEKTHTEQIAESELQTGNIAGAQAVIQSTTGITTSFTVDGSEAGNVFALSFDAIWDQLVSIDSQNTTQASSQSELKVSATLSKDGTDDLIWWTPGLFGCFSTVGTCVAVEGGDLNQLLGVSTNPSEDSNSGAGFFSIFADGLTNGDWTLTLNATTVTLLTRVPVPGTLAIFGLGLAGLGLMGRRRRKA